MTGKTATSAKWILFMFIAGLFVFPAIQKVFKPVYSKSLEGYNEPNPFPEFSFTNLFGGTFLPRLTKHYNCSIGFYSELVRLHNQIDFSLFRIPNAQQVVVGKQDYLFEQSYIDAWLGREFIGEVSIDARVGQIRRLQDLLWKQNHTLLVVVFPPDKGSFYPEKIPDRYLKKPGTVTNYQWYKRRFEESKVNFIDFNDWFLKMKDTSRYLLYPKTGIHWSSYGAFLAFDSLTRYLGTKLNKPLVEISYGNIWLTETARGRDADMDEGLNLIWSISHPSLAYPSVIFSKKPGTIFPAALFVGDSFYFTWSEGGYIANTFSCRDFWYYDHNVYVGSYNTGKKTQVLDLQAEITRKKVIILLQTNAGYGNVGYGFVDRLLNALDSANR